MDLKTQERNSRGLFLWLAVLLAGSGCAALIYEIIWLQLLQLVIGSSAISLGLLLASYMGGLCLGSFALPRVVSRHHHPLRVYAVLELGIGILGLAALFGVPFVGRLYLAGATAGITGLIVRGAVAAICLLPPTLLMGASLPAIARWIETTPKGVSRLGFLYSSNIVGAVFGCLLAGFYLLRVYDMAIATYAAASINLVLAAFSLILASGPARPTRTAEEPTSQPTAPGEAPGAVLVYIVVAMSGFTALGAEVVWTRLLSLLFGATVYTFSIILAVFLTGLWAGSMAGSFLARRLPHPRMALAGCQILLAIAITWTAYTLAHSLPFWPVDPWLSLDPWFNFELDVVRSVWAIFPGTFLWGASFPLGLAAVAVPGQDPGKLSGEIYAVNTLGSILGALAFSLILISIAGTRGSQQLLVGLAAVAAAIATISIRGVPQLSSRRIAGAATAAIVLAAGLAWTVSDVPWQVVAYGRRTAPIARALQLDASYPTTVLYRGEGINSSLLIAERAGQRHFYVSGKAEASTAPLDMRLERMMGHVPALINPDPGSVLVVGFGAGVTAGSFVSYPDVERITICELERLIPPASTKYFGKENAQVLSDPRTRMVYDDARHYIFTTTEKFDVVTTDPIHPWVKGTSTLYSKEYYQLVKRHLKPGGTVAQWLPIYDSDTETVQTELATFFSVFPNGSIWSNNINGDGYDLVLLGRLDESRSISVDEMQARLDRADYAAVSHSLNEVGFFSAVDFLATYAGQAADLKLFLTNPQINEDVNMRLQYLAGFGLNSMASPNIYRNILSYRRFPEGFLVGSGGRMDALRTLLQSRPRSR